MPKFMPPEPDNDTDVEGTIEKVKNNDSSLKELNWNNIKVDSLCLLFMIMFNALTIFRFTDFPALIFFSLSLSLSIAEYFHREISPTGWGTAHQHTPRVAVFGQHEDDGSCCQGFFFFSFLFQADNGYVCFLCPSWCGLFIGEAFNAKFLFSLFFAAICESAGRKQDTAGIQRGDKLLGRWYGRWARQGAVGEPYAAGIPRSQSGNAMGIGSCSSFHKNTRDKVQRWPLLRCKIPNSHHIT